MSHSPTKDWRWPGDEEALRVADMATMRALVDLAREAIAARDFEAAHVQEDAGHMLLVNRAAEGRDVRELARVLLPLCQTEYPRWAA